MAKEPDKQTNKWRQFRWIPVLFVCSLLVSIIALSIMTGNNEPLSSTVTSQPNDPLRPLVTLIPDEVKSILLYALMIALGVTGAVCGIYSLLKRDGSKIENPDDNVM